MIFPAKKTPNPAVTETIEVKNLADIVNDCYLEYAYKVIEDRAIPDARDGLKPSQRRVLYAMSRLGLSSTGKLIKSAKICGTTSGDYHPHGEAVIYPTMVNMATDWTYRFPLIEGQGNYGSLDGDPPAAMRYTEARLSKFGDLLLEDLSKSTVKFQSTYNDSDEEPTVLAGPVPNLLLNGSSGIAVGYATNMPSHNWGELAKVIESYIKNPNLSETDIQAIMPGPDFPSGGKIIGISGILEYYKTGKGSLIIEGKYEIDTDPKTGKEQIVITQFPEGGSPEKFRIQLASLYEKNKVVGMSDCKNYSSSKVGIRVVVELEKRANAKVILNQLLEYTCLRTSYSVNNTVLIDGRLYEKAPILVLIKTFVEHRLDVLKKKYQNEKSIIDSRLEILAGLLNVVKNLDSTISIIRKSSNPQEASDNLILSKIVSNDVQAKAVLAVTLAKLTKLEQTSLLEEKQEKEDRKKWIQNILSDDSNILKLISKEQLDLSGKYVSERKTQIKKTELATVTSKSLVTKEKTVVSVSPDDFIKRISLSDFGQISRGSKGSNLSDSKKIFATSTHDTLFCFSETGKVFGVEVYELPAGTKITRGKPITNFGGIKTTDTICSYLCLSDSQLSKSDSYLCFISKNGLSKLTELSQLKDTRSGGVVATKLKPGDSLLDVLHCQTKDDIIFSTKKGKSIRCKASDISVCGRVACGSRAIKLGIGDSVVGAVVVPKDSSGKTKNPALSIMTITSNGYGKKTLVDEYLVKHADGSIEAQASGGIGKINIVLNEKVGDVVSTMVLSENQDFLVLTKNGKSLRVSSDDFRNLGRASSGSRVVKLEPEDLVLSCCPIDTGEDFSDSSLDLTKIGAIL